jgi:hypothetical protein
MWSTAKIQASSELVAALRSERPVPTWNRTLQDELGKQTVPLSDSVRFVHALLRQELRRHEKHTLTSVAGLLWSDNGRSWRQRDDRRLVFTRARGRSLPKVDLRFVRHLQQLARSREEPLFALEFLFAAERLDEDEYSWVLATTAAELAIKEALIRAEPSLKTLLLELPSPPLHKLYGELMETYLGERSPYLAKLHEGATIRNRLVHRPQQQRLDPQRAVDYLEEVHEAIRHLVRLLRQRNLRTRGA